MSTGKSSLPKNLWEPPEVDYIAFRREGLKAGYLEGYDDCFEAPLNDEVVQEGQRALLDMLGRLVELSILAREAGGWEAVHVAAVAIWAAKPPWDGSGPPSEHDDSPVADVLADALAHANFDMAVAERLCEFMRGEEGWAEVKPILERARREG